MSEFLRDLCDTTNGVPLSLECSASYLNFRVQCLQSLSCSTPPFEAFLGQNIHVKFKDKVVTVSRCTLLKLDKTKTVDSCEHEDEESDDI